MTSEKIEGPLYYMAWAPRKVASICICDCSSSNIYCKPVPQAQFSGRTGFPSLVFFGHVFVTVDASRNYHREKIGEYSVDPNGSVFCLVRAEYLLVVSTACGSVRTKLPCA